MNAISLNRMKYLFIEYFVTHWKRDLFIFLGLFLIQSIISSLNFLFIGAFAVTVMSIILCGTFNFLHKGSQGMNYLLNPANTEEKVIVNLSIVHIYYNIMLLIPCVLGWFLGLSLSSGVDFIFILSEVEGSAYFTIIEGLFVIQSVFLFSAIYFKKHAILKTSLLFVGFLFVIVIVSLVMLANSEIVQQVAATFDSENLKNELLEKYSLLAHVVNWITVIFFWVVSYFRLRETEV